MHWWGKELSGVLEDSSVVVSLCLNMPIFPSSWCGLHLSRGYLLDLRSGNKAMQLVGMEG